jgi:hypothetical protein
MDRASSTSSLTETTLVKSELEDNFKVSQKTFKAFGYKYQSNCGSKVKATQELLVVLCENNEDLLILKRYDMEPIYSQKGSGSSTNSDI